MDQRLWLLVEWIDQKSTFASYGIIKLDTPVNNEAEISPGNTILIEIERNLQKQAQILRISENKTYLEEQKRILERQDQKMKNVLDMCMRTITEMKAETLYGEKENIQQHSSNQSPFLHYVNARLDGSTSSDSRPEAKILNVSRNNHVEKSSVKIPPHKRCISQNQNPAYNYGNFNGCCMTSSTPLPRKNSEDSYKIFIDQCTQTDTVQSRKPLEKIEEVEATLNRLYLRFEKAVAQLNITLESISLDSDIEQNSVNNIKDPEVRKDELISNQEIENVPIDPVNNSTALSHNKEVVDNSRVRRMSAQTTNNIEGAPAIDTDMVAIGKGNAIVPARVLKEIDWNSHTVATRHLLHAVFSRRVLATHSLTGKPSPAFKDRPAKKLLDPKLVEDIVTTVSSKCQVSKNLVRNAITIKCTDEAKLYRNRLSCRRARLENHLNGVPVTTPSTNESISIN